MFLTLAMMTSLMFSYPHSSNPNNYQSIEYSQINGLQIDLDIVPFGVGTGLDSVLVSYFDTETGIRTNIFNITFAQYNTEQESTWTFDILTHCNYYGYFGLFESGNYSNSFSLNIPFYDDNQDSFQLTIPFSDLNPSLYGDYDYTLRLNYLDNVQYNALRTGTSSYSEGYSQGNQDGYDSGYREGESTGYNTGYQEGYDTGYATGEQSGTGYNNGYRDGYNNGLSQSNKDFGLLNLFTGIADTPILMMRSMFDFEIFGTSVLAVVLSLFTALVVIHLLKRLIK